MSRNKKSQATDYKVGYGKPPKASQFKPGTSGNPRGRPKGLRPISAVLKDILRQRVPVTEHGSSRRMPVLVVILRRLANDAMKSDQKAIKFLLSLLDRYADSPDTALELRNLLTEDEEILARYLNPAPVRATKKR